MKNSFEGLIEELVKGSEVLELMEKMEITTKMSVIMTELDMMQEKDKDNFNVMLKFIEELANR